jgi:hypothetical protein
LVGWVAFLIQISTKRGEEIEQTKNNQPINLRPLFLWISFKDWDSIGWLNSQPLANPCGSQTLLAVVFYGAPLPPSRLRPVVIGRPHPIRRLPRAGTPKALLWRKSAK